MFWTRITSPCWLRWHVLLPCVENWEAKGQAHLEHLQQGVCSGWAAWILGWNSFQSRCDSHQQLTNHWGTEFHGSLDDAEVGGGMGMLRPVSIVRTVAFIPLILIGALPLWPRPTTHGMFWATNQMVGIQWLDKVRCYFLTFPIVYSCLRLAVSDHALTVVVIGIVAPFPPLLSIIYQSVLHKWLWVNLSQTWMGDKNQQQSDGTPGVGELTPIAHNFRPDRSVPRPRMAMAMNAIIVRRLFLKNLWFLTKNGYGSISSNP